MKSIEEMRNEINIHCKKVWDNSTPECYGCTPCPLYGSKDPCESEDPEVIKRNYQLIFRSEQLCAEEHGCENCSHVEKSEFEEPCVRCKGTALPDSEEFKNRPNLWTDGVRFPTHKTDDPVNHPSHYTKGKIEVADFIADQKLNFDRGNAVKYVCRAGSKDPSKEIQDLEKAIWYINHEIKMLKGECENAAEKEN